MRDLVVLRHPRDLRGAPRRPLVDHATHGGVDRALHHHRQPRAVQVAIGRPPHQPQQHGHVVEPVAQRPDAVGVTDVALTAGRLDAVAEALVPGDEANGVAIGGQRAREREAGRPPPTKRTLTRGPRSAGATGWRARVPEDLRAVLLHGDLRQALRATARVLGVQHLDDLQFCEVLLAALDGLGEVGADGRANALLGELRRSPPAAARVGGLEHLIEVIDLVLELLLDRARGLPVERLRTRARVQQSEQHQADEQPADDSDHDHREGIHGARVYAG